MFQKILPLIKWNEKQDYWSVDYRSINTNEILHIHQYLMKELFLKKCLELY